MPTLAPKPPQLIGIYGLHGVSGYWLPRVGGFTNKKYESVGSIQVKVERHKY